jgi:hypothetical protein
VVLFGARGYLFLFGLVEHLMGAMDDISRIELKGIDWW